NRRGKSGAPVNSRAPDARNSKLETLGSITVLPLSAISPSAAAPARRAVFPRAGNIYRQRASLKILVVKLLDGLIGFVGRRVFNKCETARFARHFVKHHIDRGHGACRGKVTLQVALHRLIWKVSYKKSVL